MVLRQRLRKVISLKTVKDLDAFPKVADAYTEISPIGGTASLISFCLILWLALSSTSEFVFSKIVYRFLPDTNYDEKLMMFIDITVAMPCNTLGADILDSTKQNTNQFGELAARDTWFEMDSAQRLIFDEMKNINAHTRERYHELHEVLWKSDYPSFIYEYLPSQATPKMPPDACRIYGTLTLNKVAGNFHINVGNALKLPQGHGHVHISDFLSEREHNFSHRINQFGFGNIRSGTVNPLEGDEKITHENMMMYQYFIDVVPTDVDLLLQEHVTYQYSVRELEHPIDHSAGSHGVPGIFFKYDLSALKVNVTQDRDSLSQFALKLGACIGGINIAAGVSIGAVKNMVAYYERKNRGW